MLNSSAISTDLRLLLPEVIWLEPEYFEQAKTISKRVTDEAQKWQTYLNALAQLGLAKWLSERIPEQLVNRDINHLIDNVSYLNVGEFKICLLATESVLDEVVNLPHAATQIPELAAHFYVVIEVLEEQEQVIIRGFLRYDQLINYCNWDNIQLLHDNYYQIPLSLFDSEPNHLLFYCRLLEPTAIRLPVTSADQNLQGLLEDSRTKLSQWLQGVFDESWQAIDVLINPEANLALSSRKISDTVKRGKLIDLGMHLGNQTVALLVNITEEAEDKLGILIQLHPTGGERFLPSDINLSLLSKVGKKLQEVKSRIQDNYIQLKPFKGEIGKCFSIEISLGDVSVREDFEL